MYWLSTKLKPLWCALKMSSSSFHLFYFRLVSLSWDQNNDWLRICWFSILLHKSYSDECSPDLLHRLELQACYKFRSGKEKTISQGDGYFASLFNFGSSFRFRSNTKKTEIAGWVMGYCSNTCNTLQVCFTLVQVLDPTKKTESAGWVIGHCLIRKDQLGPATAATCFWSVLIHWIL